MVGQDYLAQCHGDDFKMVMACASLGKIFYMYDGERSNNEYCGDR